MKKVYQTIVDKGNGNCMQAVVASLFDLELSNVPNFIEYGTDCQWELLKFFHERGYDDTCFIYSEVGHRGVSLADIAKFDGGINGYFYASVDSQTFEGVTHAVVIDTNLNVVHDPNPNGLCLNLKPSDIKAFISVKDFYIDLNGKIVSNV